MRQQKTIREMLAVGRHRLDSNASGMRIQELRIVRPMLWNAPHIINLKLRSRGKKL